MCVALELDGGGGILLLAHFDAKNNFLAKCKIF